MMLQKKSVGLEITGHTNHPQYNDAISEKITLIISDVRFSNKPKRAFDALKDFITSTKAKLKLEVLLGNKNVNQITNL